MSYDSDDRNHSRSPPSPSHQPRDRSPDFHYSGGSPAPYAAGAIPPPSQYEPGPHSPSYVPMPPSYLPNQRTLQPPPLHHRPRSMPTPGAVVRPAHPGAIAARPRSLRRRASSSSSSSSSCSSQDHRQPTSPLDKAKHALSHTFSNSTSGLGVGVLGAIVGGLAAREASERHHASQTRGHPHQDDRDRHRDKDNRAALLSTIVGAAVGGLGANAIEKRLERSRKKTGKEQDAWERKWGKDRDRLRYAEEERVYAPRRRRNSAADGYYAGGNDIEWEDRRRDTKGKGF